MRHNNILGFIVLSVLLSATSFFSMGAFFEQRQEHDKVDIHNFPLLLGEWTGTDIEVTEREYEVLETKNLIVRDYVNAQGEKISLFIIYSETNRSVFHPPEVCMRGSGTKILDKRIETINSGRYNFTTNKLYLERGTQKAIALYSYKAGTLYMDNYVLQQFYFAINQMLRKPIKGATIRVLMPITEKGEEYTLNTLKSFLKNCTEIIDNLS